MVQCGVCGMVFDALQNSDHSDDIGDASNPPVEQTDISVGDLAAPLIEPLSEEPTASSEPAKPVEQLQEINPVSLHLDTVDSNIEESVDVDLSDLDIDTRHADSSDPPQPNVTPREVNFVTRPSHQRQYLWLMTSFVLCVLVAAQFTILYRDKLTANFPDVAPAIDALCHLSNCQVQLPTDLNLVKITSTAFEADTVNPNLISMHIGLENQSDIRIAFPSLALSLTNDEDEIVVKRNFRPSEYLSRQNNVTEGIAAHEEVSAHLIIDVDGVSVSGYKISIFYNQQ